MSEYKIKDWKKLQHFKDRRPPWVKLYRELLDCPDWHAIAGDDAKTLIGLFLIASEDMQMDGNLPDVRTLAFRLRTTEKQINQSLTRLKKWVIQPDITPISSRYQDDAPETETETETETDQSKRQRHTSAENAIAFTGTTFTNTENHFDLWKKAYPAIDLQTELAKAAAWLIANPKNRKSNYGRFLTNWFVRAQDRAPGQSSKPPTKQPHKLDAYLSNFRPKESKQNEPINITPTAYTLDYKDI